MKLLGNSKYIFVVLLLCISVFLNGQETLDEIKYSEEVCTEQIDIHILLDGSGSIGYSNWKAHVIPMLNTLVDNLNISNDEINVSLTLFSTNSRELIKLKGYGSTSKDSLRFILAHLQNNYSPNGNTNLTSALLVVDTLINERMYRPDAIQLAIILTDGIPNDLPRSTAVVHQLKRKHVNVAIIGVGAGVNNEYNRILVGCDRYAPCPYYSSGSWNEAQNMIKPFLTKVCQEVERIAHCGKWEEWSECSTTCDEGRKIRRRQILHPGCVSEMTTPCKVRDCPQIPIPPVIPNKIPEKPSNPEEPPSNPNEPSNPEEPNPEEPSNPKEPSNPEEPINPEELNPKEPSNPEESNPKEPINPEDNENPLIIQDEPIEPRNDSNVIPILPIIPQKGNNIPSNLPENPSDSEVEYPRPNDNGENSNNTMKSKKNIPNEPIPSPGDNPYKGHEERIPKPHRSNDDYVYDNNVNKNNKDEPEIPNNEYEEDKNKNQSKSNNGYKIAGGIIGGLAILGCAGVGYNFIAGSSAAGLAGAEPAPFEDVIPDDDKDIVENEQFKLPEDNDWN
ncbi:sporozoite surface protein 2 [Plasmodium yoelii 17X]|uniref:Sporozoite surface protein 2 n=1 Tax=Plasmodium yoelii 17X TaxID=1323249 RepID=V7PVU0_PLAYE|nr:sporozoite surface protein 2 [Plasmodium yoelii 17X]